MKNSAGLDQTTCQSTLHACVGLFVRKLAKIRICVIKFKQIASKLWFLRIAINLLTKELIIFLLGFQKKAAKEKVSMKSNLLPF